MPADQRRRSSYPPSWAWLLAILAFIVGFVLAAASLLHTVDCYSPGCERRVQRVVTVAFVVLAALAATFYSSALLRRTKGRVADWLWFAPALAPLVGVITWVLGSDVRN